MRRLSLLFAVFFSLISVALTHATDDASLIRLAALPVFAGTLDAVSFSPDGALLASGGRDNKVRIWNAATGENLRTIEGHNDWVMSVAFNNTGTLLLSGSRDDTVRMYDVATGVPLRIITQHQADVTAVTFNPDGGVIASGGRDGKIRLHSAEGQRVIELDQFGQAVWDLAFDPHGEILTSASEDGSIWLWGLWGSQAATLQRLVGHEGPVVSIQYSANGDYLISGGLDGTVRLWDLSLLDTQDQITATVIMRGHLAPVMGLGLSADNQIAMSASLDGTVRLWDIVGTSSIGREISVINGTGAPLTNLAFNPAGNQAASVGTDGVLNLWDMGAETIQLLLNSDAASVTIVQHEIPQITGERAIPGLAASQPEIALIPETIVPTLTPPPITEVTLVAIVELTSDAATEVAIVPPSPTPSLTVTPSPTVTSSPTLTPSLTTTPSPTSTSTFTPSPTITPSPTNTSTFTPSPTLTPLPPTFTASPTIPTATPTLNIAPTLPPTLTPIASATFTASPIPPTRIPVTQIPATFVPATRAPATQIPPTAVIPPLTGGRVLSIPSAGISIGVGTFYLDGVSWAIDPWEQNVGHLQGTSWINTNGNVVIGGHSEYPNGRAGVFKNLYNVRIGDEIFVRDGDLQRRYIVTNIRTVDFRDVSVVYPTPYNQLTLITCDIPSYVAEQNWYYERLVVEAQEG